MELTQQLKKDGIAKGLCRMWQMKLVGELDMKRLIELYIKGIDFCISEDYPTLEFLRERVKGKCEPYGVFVDDETELVNPKDVVLNGVSKAMLEYDGYTVANLYIRHTSVAALVVSDHAIVTVDAFDTSHVVVAVAGDSAKVSVNLYGDSTVETYGNGITINRKNKKTYRYGN